MKHLNNSFGLMHRYKYLELFKYYDMFKPNPWDINYSLMSFAFDDHICKAFKYDKC